MADLTVVAEFPFVANKSFVSGAQRPITIPARYYPGLKQCALTDSAPAMINFRKESMIEGAIRVGWRSGGKYYQITMSKSQKDVGIDDIKIGKKLIVRVIKRPQEWLIEID